MARVSPARVAIVGGGVFGLSAALVLRERGHDVVLLEAAAIPHLAGSSSDASRAVRADYGSDELYTDLAEAALARWEVRNEGGAPVFFRDGFLLLTRAPMRVGEFERDSFELLMRRGFPLERLDADAVAHRFPALATAGFVDGYFNPRAGWVDATLAVEQLAARVRAAGVEVREGVAFAELCVVGGRVSGVRTIAGDEYVADDVVVAAGAWTPELLPWLADRMRPVAQPVIYFGATDPDRYRAPRFAPFGAEIARTGWYGFPANAAGAVKIANHGPGLALSPSGPRAVPAAAQDSARAFLRETIPALADAPQVEAKLCFYCDTFDGDFWIDRDPEREGLIVAAGGSGHGFKFAPVLGEIVADVVERKPNPHAARFRWRARGARRTEGARSSGSAE